MTKPCAVLLVTLCATLTGCQREAVAPSPKQDTPPSRSADPVKIQDVERPRFRLYKTQNIWNLLLLDTRTGRVWQAQFSVNDKADRGVLPVSTEVLAEGEDGRFSLTLTENIWNSVLVDTKNGRLWQCQFGSKEAVRGCVPIDVDSKE